MQEKHLFEYSVIRVVPLVEREEFLNAGVILYCSSQKFLQTMFELDHERFLNFCGKVSLTELHERLLAFEQISKGFPKGGDIGRLPIASRFRWLTAARSTIVQTSPVHCGFCINAAETLEKLFAQLVK